MRSTTKCSTITALAIGRRHARKHLGWALDSAAATAGAPVELLKDHRTRVLTAEEPTQARRLLADAYDDFRLEGRRMSRAHAVSAIVNSPADAVLNALPHPVIMVSPDGKIADANVAAEQFFEASISDAAPAHACATWCRSARRC